MFGEGIPEGDRQIDNTRAASSDDILNLAAALEAMGKSAEAQRFREQAHKQPEIQARKAQKIQAQEQQRELAWQDLKRRIEEARAKPEPFHDPQFDVVNLPALKLPQNLRELATMQIPSPQGQPQGNVGENGIQQWSPSELAKIRAAKQQMQQFPPPSVNTPQKPPTPR